jgi:hypothetical protein
MTSQIRSTAATVTALALAVSAGLVAGCGGDDNPAGAYLGRWYQVSPDPTQPTATGFTLSCADPVFSFLAPAPPQPPVQFLVWPSLTFEHGVLTDLVETSGNCSPLNYNIKGSTATLPNPDPYIDDVPGCAFPLNITDAAGIPLRSAFILLPDDGWTFTLLANKSTNGTNQGRLAGTGNAQIIVDDGTGTGNFVVSTPDCEFAGADTFERLTRP